MVTAPPVLVCPSPPQQWRALWHTQVFPGAPEQKRRTKGDATVRREGTGMRLCRAPVLPEITEDFACTKGPATA